MFEDIKGVSNDHSLDAEDFLTALNWLRLYDTEMVLSGRWQLSEKTIRAAWRRVQKLKMRQQNDKEKEEDSEKKEDDEEKEEGEKSENSDCPLLQKPKTAKTVCGWKRVEDQKLLEDSILRHDRIHHLRERFRQNSKNNSISSNSSNNDNSNIDNSNDDNIENDNEEEEGDNE